MFITIILLFIKYFIKISLNKFINYRNGDWGLGIGDWGLGIGPNPQSPIPKNYKKLKKVKLNNR